LDKGVAVDSEDFAGAPSGRAGSDIEYLDYYYFD